jgi:hypothetical protein
MECTKNTAKKLFACGLLIAAGGLARLGAEIIFKDNVDNYPQAKANLQQAIATAYANDEAGYFRHLHDSPTDHMYVDVNNNQVGNATAIFAPSDNTMFVRENFAEACDTPYHEAWHRMQMDRAPNIHRILPPFYAVLINMLQEAGAVWYETQIYEKVNSGKRATKPAGMSEDDFRNQRFDQFFETFMQTRIDYLDGAINNCKDNYEVRENSKYIVPPQILEKTAAQYNGNLEVLNRILQVYINAYLPDEVRLNKTPEQLIAFFAPIIANYDIQREARGQVSVRQLNQKLLDMPAKLAELQNTSPNKTVTSIAALTQEKRTQLDALLVELDGNNNPRTTPPASLTPQQMAELIRSSAYGVP